MEPKKKVQMNLKTYKTEIESQMEKINMITRKEMGVRN